MKALIHWLIMRKIKDANGQMQAAGVSYTKAALVAMAVLKGLETSAVQLGYPVVIPEDVYKGLGIIAGIAMHEGIDRSAPSK